MDSIGGLGRVDVGRRADDLDLHRLAGPVGGGRLDLEIGEGTECPLDRSAGAVEREVGVVQEVEADRGDVLEVGPDRELDLVLGRGVARRQQRAVGLGDIPLAAGRDVVDLGADDEPGVAIGGEGRLPIGHPVGPVGGPMLEVGLDLGDRPEDVGAHPGLVGGVDRDVGLVGIIEVGEHPIIFVVRQGIILVGMTLGALDRQAEDALADGIHPVEHRLHAELFRIDRLPLR